MGHRRLGCTGRDSPKRSNPRDTITANAAAVAVFINIESVVCRSAVPAKILLSFQAGIYTANGHLQADRLSRLRRFGEKDKRLLKAVKRKPE